MKKILITISALFFASSVFASGPLNLSQAEVLIQKSLNKFCIECHDADLDEGKVRLDNFSSLSADLKFEMLNRMEEQIYLNEMPPKDEKVRPDKATVNEWLTTIEKWNEFNKSKSKFKTKLSQPKYANYLDHDKLFSGEYKNLKGFTYDREWIISEFIFNDKVNKILHLNQAPQIHGKKQLLKGGALGIEYVNPFLLPDVPGVRYYANEKINSSHFLSMIDNAKNISERMVGYLNKRNKDYLPAVAKALEMKEKHDLILKTRHSFLDKFIDTVCADLYGSKNKELLPKYTKIKLDGEIVTKVVRYGKNGWSGRVGGIFGNPLLEATRRFAGSGKPLKTIIEECEEFWFHKGHNRELVARLMDLLRKELTTIQTYKQHVSRDQYNPLSDSEMAVVTSTLKKVRTQGMPYKVMVAECMDIWRSELQEIRDKSNPLKGQLLKDLVTQIYEKLYERHPSAAEIAENEQLLKAYTAKAGEEEAVKKLIQALILRSEFISRNEYGTGKADQHGRRLLSPRDASYAIAYALTDSSPDEQLIKAVQDGRLNTREDYKREIERLLKDNSQYTIIDTKVNSGEDINSITDSPVRKLRFFREFFGYYLAPTVFKDPERFGPGIATLRLVSEADMLVDHIIKKDKNVFEELLGTDKFYVYHNFDNENVLEFSEAVSKFYYYFNKLDWMGFKTVNDLKKHEAFLKENPLPGMKLSAKLESKDFTKFIDTMLFLDGKFRKRHKYIAPFIGVNGVKSGALKRITSRNSYFMGSSSVTKHFNINSSDWNYPPVQPAKVENRKGILTHPAWLMAFSQNTHSDPVVRGKWVREMLLAGSIPDVPIGVEAQVPELLSPAHEDYHKAPKTLRDRLASVTEVKDCWRCHKYMNPLGNAFEMYDDFGRYRTEESLEHPDNIIPREKKNTKFKKVHPAQSGQGRVGKRMPPPPTYKTLPVNTSGVLEGSGDSKLDGKVKDSHDLIERLIKSTRVRQSIIRHAFRYFMGRNEMLSDSKTLIDADQAYVRSGGSFNAVIVSLLTSDSFIYRKEYKE